jgi:hypothetical protein
MSSLQSTPPLNRLDSLESPLRRYSGRRVMHIDLPASPAAVSSLSSSVSSPSVTSSSSMSPSVKTKSARQLQFASPPAVKRSRSVENSDDDEFALAVASDASVDASPVRSDDVSTTSIVTVAREKKKKFEKFKKKKKKN